MNLRRVTALLMAAPLLRLNVERADVACASHGALPNTPVEASLHTGEHQHLSQDAPPTENEPCDAPAQRDCCQVLASCSTVLGSDDRIVFAERSLHGGVQSAILEFPRSAIAAPDPPPPKV